MMIELVKFERADVDRLIRWAGTESFLVQWSGGYFQYPLDRPQLERYLASAEGTPPVRRIFKAVQRDQSRVVGHIELNAIDLDNRTARVSRVLVGEGAGRGQGVGAEMVRRALEIAFDELALHRVELMVYDFNRPAIACYEKVGFVKEGLIREGKRVGDEYWSTYVMGILRKEWHRRRKDVCC